MKGDFDIIYYQRVFTQLLLLTTPVNFMDLHYSNNLTELSRIIDDAESFPHEVRGGDYQNRLDRVKRKHDDLRSNVISA